MYNSQHQQINNRYTLNRVIGAGVFGEVWLAYDDVMDMDVALKMYKSADSGTIAKLQSDFKIAFKISHENILPPKHLDIYENHPFVIMPYCPKGSISTMAGSLEESVIWNIIRDVSSALSEIHRNSLSHQNVKPTNIMVLDDNTFALSDMGLSKSTRATMSKDETQKHVSSVVYKAPECRNGKVYSPQSDIWSLGVVAYEMAVGHAFSYEEYVSGDYKYNYPDYFSEEFKSVVNSCLSENPNSRPTAEELSGLKNGSFIAGDSELGGTVKSNGKNEGKTQYRVEPGTAKRNLFVTIYEYALAVYSALMMCMTYFVGIIDSTVSIDNFESLYYHEFLFIGFLFSIKLLGEILLIKKIRTGFWIASIGTFCSSFALVKLGGSMDPVGIVAVAIAVGCYMLFLWLVLLIRKNGISQWRGMFSSLNLRNNRWVMNLFLLFCLIYAICEIASL